MTVDLTTTCHDVGTNGVRIISPSIEHGDLTPRPIAQLHITVEKTVDYGLEDDTKSGPSSDPPTPFSMMKDTGV
jgi:hypothetical protein